MNRKTFALIIALSVIAQPIMIAQDQTTDHAAYKKGVASGALASLAASCFVFGSHIATTAQNGIYIPKWLFKPAGSKQTYIPKPWSDGSYRSGQLQMVSMPKYEKERNPLYDWFLNEKGASKEQFNILTPNLVNTIAITSLATAVGAFIYWIYNTRPTPAENDASACIANDREF